MISSPVLQTLPVVDFHYSWAPLFDGAAPTVFYMGGRGQSWEEGRDCCLLFSAVHAFAMQYAMPHTPWGGSNTYCSAASGSLGGQGRDKPDDGVM